uniref:Uncharacterized protein n=2 Tax=Hemiselmis andersenii TaxID=464988 RepID=A0A6U5C4C5_HEMAN|mmetsp:Transcript_13496/g.31288  ORF Transcript_13496/g.31288 Transcript_13496/m.31288 type:complete len:230 (+) Transcript_13496:182-871(+)
MGGACTSMMVNMRADRDAKNRQKRKEKEREANYLPGDHSTKVEEFDNGDDVGSKGEKRSSGSVEKIQNGNGKSPEKAQSFSAWGDTSENGKGKKGKAKKEDTVQSFSNIDDDEPPGRAHRQSSSGKKEKKSALERAEEAEAKRMGGPIMIPLPTEDNRYRNEYERKKFDAQDERERKEKRIRDICIKLKLNMKTVKADQIKVRGPDDELSMELKELLVEREAYQRSKGQ